MLRVLWNALMGPTDNGEPDVPVDEPDDQGISVESNDHDSEIEVPMINIGMANKITGVPDSKNKPNDVNGNATADIEETSDDERETVEATGIITAFDQFGGKGVVDRQYQFDIDKFSEENLGKYFQLGSKVDYKAERSLSQPQWEMKFLKLHESKVEKINRERIRHRKVVAQVKAATSEYVKVEIGKELSNLSIQIPMGIVRSCSKIYWMSGDWMQFNLENLELDEPEPGNDFTLASDVTRGKISGIAPLKTKTIVGKVTKCKRGLLIDHSIYFTQKVCRSNCIFPEGTPVRCTAIESSNRVGEGKENVNWRAILVERSRFLQYTASDVDMDADAVEWMTDEYSYDIVSRHKALLDDKWGIKITPRVIRFPPVTTGATTTKTITISNTAASIIRLHKISCKVDPSVCNIEIKVPSKYQDDGVIPFLPNMDMVVDLKCHALLIGKTTELCVFTFDDFQIGRIVVVIGQPEGETDLEKNAGDKDFSIRKEVDINEIIADRDRRCIKSSQKIRAPFFSQKRLPAYEVPGGMWEVFRDMDEEKLKGLYKNALQPLSYENYKEKFMVSLWFEEMENQQIRRQYDMTGVVLTKVGEKYTFTAPGLQDFQPPVNIRENVDVRDPENPDGCRYEGTIVKLFGDQVTCMFSDAFNLHYTGFPLNVHFRLGRSTYRRCHFAVETAVGYLGEPFLFPTTEIRVQNPRIVVLEEEVGQEGILEGVQEDESVGDNVYSPTESIFPKIIAQTRRNLMQMGSPSNAVADLQSRRVSSYRSRFISNTAEKPSCTSVILRWFNEKLNDEQKDAVRRIIRGQARPLPYIIYGPPGTGKTVTVVEAIMQNILPNTNQYHPGDFLRLNGFLRSEQAVPETIVPFCTDGEDLANVAMHRLIISTCTTAGQFFTLDLSVGHFTHVFIDEAGYCTEPEAMIPAILLAWSKGGQLILAGDPNQLGPVLMSDVAQNCKLSMSFLERLMVRPLYRRDVDRFPKEKYNPLVLTKLVKNYRAHPTLLKLPSRLFYDDDLESAASFEEAHELCQNPLLNTILATQGVPLIFHGIQGKSLRERGCTSWYNIAEVLQIVAYVVVLKSHCGLNSEDIGIITPYRKQVDKIRFALEHAIMDDNIPKVASVEEFQGGERKVMIISTVRSVNDNQVEKNVHRLGFLYQAKRFNVAITRAKALMIVVGNPHVLSKNRYWSQLLRYSIELSAYKGCNLPVDFCPKIPEVFAEYEQDKKERELARAEEEKTKEEVQHNLLDNNDNDDIVDLDF
ncbi:putative helicase Mov10l1 [Orchesella cincta]|uniref:Putative helicase Mov10l1 n=1 Tax=Orchesella cincta TaxID=48709 RepID=A0A1D2NCZ8_ORCCI|nr:putative helicase Mov10l1 [Orchesella cincta]